VFVCSHKDAAHVRGQIVAGFSNGQIGVLYSPRTSLNGAKLPQSKGPPKKATIEDMSDALSAPTILTPHALPQFRDGDLRGEKRKRDNVMSKNLRPEMPVTGPGRGGRVGASATQHVVQNLVRDTTRDEDVSSDCSCRARDGHGGSSSWLRLSVPRPHPIGRRCVVERWLTVARGAFFSLGRRSSSTRTRSTTPSGLPVRSPAVNASRCALFGAVC
jgi:hypothetical protein